MTIYFEDFVVGHVFEFGDVVVTEEEIIEFATRYDPQPFHIDPEAAKETVFGGLIASGWLTCSLFMRMLVDGLINDSSGQGSPGMEMTNQDGIVVMSMSGVGMYGRRPSTSAVD